MIRGIIQAVFEGVIKRFTASGRADETITNREYFQHYGFTSRPLAGAEGIIIKEGNHILMVASDDRRYRIALEDGEVALYTDEGDHLRFKRGKEIYIKSGNKLVAEIENEATITTKSAVVTASTSCQVNSPLINLGGDRADLKFLVDERIIAWLTSHTHGSGPAPSQSLSAASVCTEKTKAN